MNRALVWKLAVRYMRGKGAANAVPVLSRISMIAIAVSSCAMIVLFSVFNGFEGLVDHLYRAFYPDIKIYAAKGKFFKLADQQYESIGAIPGVSNISRVLQDNVLVNSEEGETIPVILKGIDTAYFTVNHVRPYIRQGSDSLMVRPVATAIVGQSIAGTLGIDVNNVFSRIAVYYPNTSAQGLSLDAATAFESLVLKPDGLFNVQEEFDGKYILADLGLVQGLMHQPDRISSLELKLADESAVNSVRSQLGKILGPGYKIETRFEQNKSVYMVMQSEKWAGYAILLFVLLIASFNMIGALSLLVLEKQKDMGILKAMGLSSADISRVVLLEGVLWSLTGGITGVAIGLILCFCQSHFELVKIEGAFIINAYPVAVQFSDILVVLLTVAAVGLLAAVYPARRAAQRRLTDIMSGK